MDELVALNSHATPEWVGRADCSRFTRSNRWPRVSSKCVARLLAQGEICSSVTAGEQGGGSARRAPILVIRETVGGDDAKWGQLTPARNRPWQRHESSP
jgi:hypothetical protein